MNIAAQIVQKFAERPRDKGIRALARSIDKPHTTVARWVASGHIPAHEQARVLSAARAAGIDLTPADFFPHPPAGRSDPDHSPAEMPRGEAA